MFAFFFCTSGRSLVVPSSVQNVIAGGVDEIKTHTFFASIDWVALFNKRVKPPFKPAVSREDEAFYFDSEFTCKTPRGEH